MNRLSTRALLLLVALLAALILVACEEEEEVADTTPEATEVATEVSAEATEVAAEATEVMVATEAAAEATEAMVATEAAAEATEVAAEATEVAAEATEAMVATEAAAEATEVVAEATEEMVATEVATEATEAVEVAMATEEPMAATEEAAAEAVNLLETIRANENLTTLVTALNLADAKDDLIAALEGEGPLTVFAPTNEAFTETLREAGLGVPQVAGRPDLVTVIIQSHVVAGSVMAADLEDGQEIETLSGEVLTVTIEDGKVFINGFEVVEADVAASNGTIHVINGVIVPADVVAELTATPEPTEEAAAEATEVAAEATEAAEVAMATEEPMVATEEPMAATEEAMAATEEAMTATEEAAEAVNLLETIRANENLTTLVTALNLADAKDELIAALEGEGPLTIFTPTNEAFTETLREAGLGVPQVAGRPDLVTVILQSHVVAGNVMAADLEDGQEIETLSGEVLTVTIEDGKVFINGFEVLEADVAASNGTIHVINGVIVPADVVAELTAPPAPSATPTKRP